MDGRKAFERNSKMRRFIKTYNVQKDVEGHDNLCSEGTLHIKKKSVLYSF